VTCIEFSVGRERNGGRYRSGSGSERFVGEFVVAADAFIAASEAAIAADPFRNPRRVTLGCASTFFIGAVVHG
jgi:hypothetical protein